MFRRLHWFVRLSLMLGLLAVALPCVAAEPATSPQHQVTVADRLWIWGHPAGVYNDNYLRPMKLISEIEPVDAARRMGLSNMIFVRCDGKPVSPLDAYYEPFRSLDRVYWSLVAAGGGTSQAERDAAFALAEQNENIVGFILDDFFHEPAAGNAADPLPEARIWLAANGPEFPVTLTITPQKPVQCDTLELVQTDWPTGDYRAREIAVDLSSDGESWQQAARGTMSNQPGVVLRLPLPPSRFAAARLRFLDTYDQQGAMSVGLAGLRFLAAGRPVDTSGWTASASSTYPEFEPAALISQTESAEPPFRASLSPEELRALRERRVRGRNLPLMAVIYTRQVKPRARAHIAEVDQLCLWTWRPADLKNLEANFAALQRLAPEKPLLLGCYMYDFNECKPMPMDLMRRQVELGYEWLKAGRIQGMIFLATPNVDVDLEAVDWTADWIRAEGNKVLEAP